MTSLDKDDNALSGLRDGFFLCPVRLRSFLSEELQERRIHLVGMSPGYVVGTFFDHYQFRAFDHLCGALSCG